jgi:hypothetical protein
VEAKGGGQFLREDPVGGLSDALEEAQLNPEADQVRGLKAPEVAADPG